MPNSPEKFNEHVKSPETAAESAYSEKAVPFRPDYKRNEYAEAVEEITKKSSASELVKPNREPDALEVSDAMQVFLDKLQRSESQAAAVAVLNEALSAANHGRISADDANKLVEAAQRRDEELSRTA